MKSSLKSIFRSLAIFGPPFIGPTLGRIAYDQMKRGNGEVVAIAICSILGVIVAFVAYCTIRIHDIDSSEDV